jgi:hypothetical protein
METGNEFLIKGIRIKRCSRNPSNVLTVKHTRIVLYGERNQTNTRGNTNQIIPYSLLYKVPEFFLFSLHASNAMSYT